jgi:hypothetical protein
MHRSHGNDILQTLEFARNQRAMRYLLVSQRSQKLHPAKRKRHTPWTRIRNIEMIPPLLRWKLCTRLAGDEVTELRYPALEFAGFGVLGHPFGDGGFVSCLFVLSAHDFNPL